MKYYVKTDESGRVQYITQEEYASQDMMPVDYLPDGDITDYCLENGTLVYDPLPKQDNPPEQESDKTVWDDLATAIREGVNSV